MAGTWTIHIPFILIALGLVVAGFLLRQLVSMLGYLEWPNTLALAIVTTPTAPYY